MAADINRRRCAAPGEASRLPLLLSLRKSRCQLTSAPRRLGRPGPASRHGVERGGWCCRRLPAVRGGHHREGGRREESPRTAERKRLRRPGRGGSDAPVAAAITRPELEARRGRRCWRAGRRWAPRAAAASWQRGCGRCSAGCRPAG